MARYSNIRKSTTDRGIVYYTNAIYPNIELDEDDIYIIASQGDRYDKLAAQFYGNASYWWIIAAANESVDISSLTIQSGL